RARGIRAGASVLRGGEGPLTPAFKQATVPRDGSDLGLSLHVTGSPEGIDAIPGDAPRTRIPITSQRVGRTRAISSAPRWSAAHVRQRPVCLRPGAVLRSPPRDWGRGGTS